MPSLIGRPGRTVDRARRRFLHQYPTTGAHRVSTKKGPPERLTAPADPAESGRTVAREMRMFVGESGFRARTLLGQQKLLGAAANVLRFTSIDSQPQQHRRVGHVP